MKKILAAGVLMLLVLSTSAQEKTAAKESKKEFLKNVKIAQSMETAEQMEEPAQLQLTLPKKDSSSWLINLGMAIKLRSKSANKIANLNAEYHKNTLTDEQQNNLSIGYGLQWLLGTAKNTDFFLAADAKYVYDGIEIKNSLAGNLLFTFANDGPFNAFKKNEKQTTGLFLSLYGGLQWQHAFKAASDSSEGFILRPMAKTAFYFDIYGKQETVTPSPRFRLSVDYTLRTDAVNSTSVGEGFTHLLSAGGELFLSYKPVRVSIGASFNTGSDPMKGLAKQQYWLISLNLFKD